MLSLLNVQAAQALPGPYSIIGFLDSGGAPLDQNKSLCDQGVSAGSALSAIVETISAVHARSAGKVTGKEQMVDDTKPARTPMPEPTPQQARTWTGAQRAAAAPAGDASTSHGKKRGPRSDTLQIDKREQPELWASGTPFILAGGIDATARAARMAATVAPDFGVPAADGMGRGIWCLACSKLQPLPKEFNLQNWRTHTTRASDLHGPWNLT